MPGVDAFDKNVDRYEQWFLDNPLAYVSELHAVKSLLPQEGTGMEIGIGTGRFSVPLGIKQGVEPSTAMAERARKKGIEAVIGVAEHLPYGDGMFDFCLMVTTVCFLDDIKLAFSEARRVLKPGGFFLIGFVDKNSRLGKEYLSRKDKSVFYREATFYSSSEMAMHLESAGFTDLVWRQTLFKPLAELTDVEPVKEGYGEGAFVVVRGVKKQQNSNKHEPQKLRHG